MILGISGLAGSGKDAAASVLVRECGFVRVAFADELKRVTQRLFGWDEERLWGPSARRNEPDPAWGGLTARRALQVLGTEVGRALHPDVWVRQVLRVHEQLKAGGCYYDHVSGLRRVGAWVDGPEVRAKTDVVVPDVRFRNEAEAIRTAGGFVLRVVRPGAGLVGEAGEHASETELGHDPAHYDARILNDGTLAEFEERVAAFGAILLGNAWPVPPSVGPWPREHRGVLREAEHRRDCGCRACSGSF